MEKKVGRNTHEDIDFLAFGGDDDVTGARCHGGVWVGVGGRGCGVSLGRGGDDVGRGFVVRV